MSQSHHGNLSFSTCPTSSNSRNSRPFIKLSSQADQFLIAKSEPILPNLLTDVLLLPSKTILRVNRLFDQMSTFPPNHTILSASTRKALRKNFLKTKRKTQRNIQQLSNDLQQQIRKTQAVAQYLRKQFRKCVQRSPLSKHMSEDYMLGCLDAVLATFVISACVFAIRKSTRRFATADDIPVSFIRRQGTLHGVVIAVRDGDNVRIQHTPFLHRVLPYLRHRARRSAKLLSESTINIRLAGVDAPECVHGARPGQPFGKHARSWLKKFATGRHVHCHLHSVDQYRRVVATVYVKHTNPVLQAFGLGLKNVGLELVKSGYATVYTGAGAQYGGTRALRRYVDAEARARKSKIGMWAKGEQSVVLPSEFKRMIKTAAASVSGRPDLPKADLKRTRQPAAEESGKGEDAPGVSQLFRIAVGAYEWLRRLR